MFYKIPTDLIFNENILIYAWFSSFLYCIVYTTRNAELNIISIDLKMYFVCVPNDFPPYVENL